MGEIFKEIPNCPGYYADEKGNILSLKRKEPRVIKQCTMKSGFKTVPLFIGKKLKTGYVSRMVLSAFYGYPAAPHLCYANHIDGDLSNCALANLEWIICETTAEYDPTKSKRKGVLKPAMTKARMTECKKHQSIETRRKAAETRRRTCALKKLKNSENNS